MIFEQFTLGLDLLTFLFLLLSMLFLVKNREYERFDFERSINALLFGLLFFILITLINVFVSLSAVYPQALSFLGDNIDSYVVSFMNISHLALAPFFGICLLVAVLFIRDALHKYA